LCEDARYWDGIFDVMCLGNVILSCSEYDLLLVANESVFPHIPNYLTGSEFEIVNSGAEVQKAFDREVESSLAESTGEDFKWSWWTSGFVGAFILSALTLANIGKVVWDAVTGAAVPWAELAPLPFIVFGLGFICGVVVWLLRGASQQLGWIGDSLIGVVVMNIFFMSCMILFAPEMVKENISGGAMMLGLATVIGAIAGPFWGRDIRKELSTPNE
jgi:hypothetical protein